jgi:hypothetical protein
MRIPSLRLLLVAGGAVVIATAGFAYMASNTVATSYLGQGTGTVSGYAVTNISFDGIPTMGGGQIGTLAPLTTYAPGDAQDGVTTVSFNVNPDNATFAAVDLYNGSGNIVGGGGASNCHEAGGLWTCTVTANDGSSPIPVTQIFYIDVLASQ